MVKKRSENRFSRRLALSSLCLFLVGLAFLFSACSPGVVPGTKDDEKTADRELNQEMAELMEIYSRAAVSGDPEAVDDLEQWLEEFDSRYSGGLSRDFSAVRAARQDRLSGGDGGIDPHTDLPFDTDGAVYLSGGSEGMVSTVIDWVAPTVTEGAYFHGAVLDQDKFDPTNYEALCLQTAIVKGAGYETPQNWMYEKANVTVMEPQGSMDLAGLGAAQDSMHQYCRPENTDMQYGFFENYVDVSSLVDKADNYYWYCTKVVWRVYDALGYDIDSNAAEVDWTTSGLYDVVNTYYKARYWYNWGKAAQKTQEYIQNARDTMVLAEEILFSPHLNQVYEDING